MTAMEKQAEIKRLQRIIDKHFQFFRILKDNGRTNTVHSKGR